MRRSTSQRSNTRGQTRRAIAIVRETLPAARSGADRNVRALLLSNLAAYLVAVDDLHDAAAAARESIGIHAEREPDHAHVAIAIEHLALVFALRGDLARAATLEGYAARRVYSDTDSRANSPRGRRTTASPHSCARESRPTNSHD